MNITVKPVQPAGIKLTNDSPDGVYVHSEDSSTFLVKCGKSVRFFNKPSGEIGTYEVETLMSLYRRATIADITLEVK